MFRLALLLAACLALQATAKADSADELAAALNALRGQVTTCSGGRATPASPLASNPQLKQAAAALAAAGTTHADTDLNATLRQSGYRARKSMLLRLSGLTDTAALASYAERGFCQVLHAPDWSEIGIYQDQVDGARRTFIVLASPLRLPQADARGEAAFGPRVLDLVNQARSSARQCGNRRFAPAPPLTWDDKLAEASRAHADEMARYQYFSHGGRDNSQAAQRAQRAGYAWKAIGENIAAGQASAEEVTAGWIASPDHCANLMNPAFSAMGVAYALNPASPMGIYWTQVFGAPR